ncbi:hypothetical protein [Oceanobacillus sojae]|nr:hypothetical protein [Oceanobacillus sojae]
MTIPTIILGWIGILITPVKLFAKAKPNVYVTNVETLLFFVILMIYIT